MLGLALVAMLAFGALSAGAASAAEAPRWKVKGAYLGAGASKAFTATSTTEVVLNGGGVIFTAPTGECSQTGEIEGSAAGSPGKKKNVVLSCKKVKVLSSGGTELPQCSVKSTGAEAGTITTNSLKGTLVWLNQTGGAAGDLIEPTASGTEWVKIEVTGATCPIKGNYPVSSMAINEVLPVEEEAVTGAINLPKSQVLSYWNNEAVRVKQTIAGVKVKGGAAALSGQLSFSLNSKESFGVSPTPKGSAARWKVGNWFLPAGATKPFTATGSMKLSFFGIPITMPECTATGKLIGSSPGQAGTSETAITCQEISVEGDPSCPVHTVGSGPGVFEVAYLSTLSLSGGNVTEVSTPSWRELQISSCSLAMKQSMKGSLIAGPFSTEAMYPWRELSLNSSGLKVGPWEATLEGNLKYVLTSGESSGVFPS
jgi:hypothetical protein